VRDGRRSGAARVLIAVLADAAAIVIFAALGRGSHEEGVTAGGVLVTAAPFLIGAAAGWLAARGWRRPSAPTTGVVVWAAAVGVGMVLRGLVFDRGVAPSFVVVAAVALGLLIVGWRLVARGRGRAGQPRSQSSTASSTPAP
jgi:peptidoglycan/LPS O-acetylase OafA/YrhL